MSNSLWEFRRSGRAQAWLQHQFWPLWCLGNGLSGLRFWAWRATGGSW